MKPQDRKSTLPRFAAQAACILSAAILASTDSYANPEPRPNVLFIMVDDLGPWLGTYGRDYVHSPHIDALAQSGMQFNRAYAQVPVCGASRSSMFTGILPTQTRFTRARSSVEGDAPGAVTLPQLMRENGYHTYSVGKVFDDSSDTAERSWSEAPVVPGADMYEWGERGFAVLHTFDPESDNYVSDRGRGPIYEHPDVDDDAYFDGQVAKLAIEKLREMEQGDAPFFLAAGFFNPHLPFYAPKRYWDLYERDEIPLAEVRTRPQNAPSQLRGSHEFRAYHLKGMDVNSDEFHRVMRHGYFACVSYVDKLIGDLLAELERLELHENTIVVLWGDHGFNLGEHGFWGKHNLMSGATHIPILIRAPGVTQPGSTSDSLVESTDLFPTLAALTGIEPSAGLAAQWDGMDLSPLLDGSAVAIPRDAAYTRWQHGDNIVTWRFSYSEFGRYRGGARQEVADSMLYDLKKDPGENINVVEEENYLSLASSLSERMLLVLGDGDPKQALTGPISLNDSPRQQTLPQNSITLEATLDTANYQPDELSYQWEIIYAPGEAWVQSPNTLNPRIVMSTPGTYYVRVRAFLKDQGDMAVEQIFPLELKSPREESPIQSATLTDDAHGHRGNGNVNYGAEDSVWVKDSGQSANAREGFFKFTLPPSEGVEVTGVRLRLYRIENSTVQTNELVLLDDTTWTEDTLTWNNRPTAGTTVATWWDDGDAGWVEVDLDPSKLSSIFEDGVASFRLSITSQADSNPAAKYASKDGAYEADRAQLLIEVR